VDPRPQRRLSRLRICPMGVPRGPPRCAFASLVTGQSAISIVDPRLFADGTYNARLVVLLSVSAGLIAVLTWRSAYHLRRPRT
jgi:hypothetical protein